MEKSRKEGEEEGKRHQMAQFCGISSWHMDTVFRLDSPVLDHSIRVSRGTQILGVFSWNKCTFAERKEISHSRFHEHENNNVLFEKERGFLGRIFFTGKCRQKGAAGIVFEWDKGWEERVAFCSLSSGSTVRISPKIQDIDVCTHELDTQKREKGVHRLIIIIPQK